MKSVLLVDDDNALRLSMGLWLTGIGHIVYTAKDAVTAVSTAAKCAPDVVVLDVRIPAGDVFLFALRLQNLVGFGATPIIFMTACADPCLRERAMAQRAAGFLIKPFDATTLIEAVDCGLSRGEHWWPLASGEWARCDFAPALPSSQQSGRLNDAGLSEIASNEASSPVN